MTGDSLERVRDGARMVVELYDFAREPGHASTDAHARAETALAMWRLWCGTEDADAALARARLVAGNVREAMP